MENAKRETINYHLTGIEVIKKDIENIVGIPYEEYEKLDLNIQQKLMRKNRRHDSLLNPNKVVTTEKEIEKRIYSFPERVLRKIKKITTNRKN